MPSCCMNRRLKLRSLTPRRSADAGDTREDMAFQRKLARTRFERMMTSPSSAQFYSILQAGLA